VRIAVTAAAATLVTTLAGCGYHVAGHSDLLPKTIETVCIPAFANATIRYKLTDRLPNAIAKEFISRTRYHIISDCASADAVLRGMVMNYISYATVADPKTGRQTAVDLRLYMKIDFTERATGKVLFSRPMMEVRERYEVSEDPNTYVDESDSALDRASRAAAATIVTAILTNF
jgi:outer membrane lipopolysaccharide assembly protein LptE/RlpB